MTTLDALLAAFCLSTTCLHLVSTALAMRRCRRQHERLPAPRNAPAVTILRPVADWKADTGVLCSPPIGSLPAGLWSEVECAFLNTYQARWQYAADSAGIGFAQGKTMLWRRQDLVAAGGIGALVAPAAAHV